MMQIHEHNRWRDNFCLLAYNHVAVIESTLRWLLYQYLFTFWGCVVMGTALIRREAWGLVGGMREQFGLLADIDMWMRLAMRWSVGYVPEPDITVRHQRPSYYPDMYKGSSWSWQRQRFIYEIHASNRLDYLKLNTLLGRLQW